MGSPFPIAFLMGLSYYFPMSFRVSIWPIRQFCTNSDKGMYRDCIAHVVYSNSPDIINYASESEARRTSFGAIPLFIDIIIICETLKKYSTSDASGKRSGASTGCKDHWKTPREKSPSSKWPKRVIYVRALKQSSVVFLLLLTNLNWNNFKNLYVMDGTL